MSRLRFNSLFGRFISIFIILIFIASVAVEINFCRKQPLIFMLAEINEANPFKAWIYKNGIYFFRGDKEEINRLNRAEVHQIETARQVVLLSVLIKDRIDAKKMLEFFLSRGLDINARNGLIDDGSALFDAVGSLNDNAVELLLTHGADLNIVSTTSNFKGLTALQVAKIFQNKFPDRDYRKIIELLDTASSH